MAKKKTESIPHDEMSLQDYQALHIMCAMVNNGTESADYTSIAEKAYAAADALCTARKDREG